MTTLTIGLTHVDRPGDYIPMMDGYRTGAPQDRIIVHLPDELAARPVQDIAEACFIALNIEPHPGQLAYHVAKLLTEHCINVPTRSMCVGDTVTVGDETLACAKVGWTPVAL